MDFLSPLISLVIAAVGYFLSTRDTDRRKLRDDYDTLKDKHHELEVRVVRMEERGQATDTTLQKLESEMATKADIQHLETLINRIGRE